MRITIIFFVFILVLGSLQHIVAQQPQQSYSLLKVADDIPDSRITGIVQGPRGYVWIGTVNGLYRYDGLRYKEFKNAPGPEKRISFNHIQHLWLFMNRYLIIEGIRNLNIMDIREETLLYSSPSEKSLIQSLHHTDKCFFIFEDAFYSTSLYTFSPKGVLDSIADFIPDSIRINKGCCDKNGELYFFDRKARLWKGNPSREMCQIIDFTTYKGRRPLFLPTLTCDENDQLWAFDHASDAYDGIYRLDEKNTFVKMSDLDHLTTALPDQDPGTYFLYHMPTKALNYLDLNTFQITPLLTVPQPIGDISSILKDEQGNLWLGSQHTSQQGIVLAHPHLPAFHKILYEPGKEFQAGIPCRDIEEGREGEILIGSNRGIYRWQAKTDNTALLHLPPDNGELYKHIWKIVKDPDNPRIWFTKEENGIFEYHLEKNSIINYKQTGQVSNRMLGMTLDPAGKLWIGTYSGITWFDTRQHAFRHQPDVSAHFYEVNGYNWVQTDINEFWLCSSNGLFRFDSTMQIKARYNTETRPHLLSNEVFDIVKNRDVYWIATDNGLHRLQGDDISTYTMDQGLAHNSIATIEFDQEDNLWIATFGGLSKLHAGTEHFQNFYVEDGLPHNEFNRLGKHRTPAGQLFFSGQNGVLHFHPRQIIKRIPAYALVLTDFYTFSKQGELVKKTTTELNKLETIHIPAGNKYFQVEFTLLNFINAEDNRYSYYLEGLEAEWRGLTTLPVIQYNNLPAGNYTLHIKAVSPSGLWSKNTLDLRIIVHQHFYKTAGFRLLILVILLGIGYLIIRNQIIHRLQLEQLRNRISSDLHDEVGGVLSGVAMQMDLLETRSPESLKPFMQRIAINSRNAASKMRDVIWAIDSRKELMQDLLDRMKAYTLELLVPLNINYTFNIQIPDTKKRLSVEFRQNVYLIFKEAMTNIIKHAQASHVNITILERKNYFLLQIEDDGVGIEFQSIQTGQGLSNMKTRAARVKADLQIRKSEKEGTIVQLVVS